MQIYRISSPKYVGDLSGNGAKLYGGRWNEKGVPLVYFASSRALAMMELLVHLGQEDLDREYAIAVFDVPENSIHKVSLADLPDNWKNEEQKNYLRSITAKFVAEGKYLMIQAPSVLVEEESNYLLNPLHIDTSKIKLVSQRLFSFDHRLKN